MGAGFNPAPFFPFTSQTNKMKKQTSDLYKEGAFHSTSVVPMFAACLVMNTSGDIFPVALPHCGEWSGYHHHKKVLKVAGNYYGRTMAEAKAEALKHLDLGVRIANQLKHNWIWNLYDANQPKEIGEIIYVRGEEKEKEIKKEKEMKAQIAKIPLKSFTFFAPPAKTS